MTIVLALNSGSSSLKFGLYRVADMSANTLLLGAAESIGESGSRMSAKDESGATVLDESAPIADQGDALRHIETVLRTYPAPEAISHRVVHGGPHLRRHCRIDEDVLRALEAATPFAPLHMPSSLALIRAASAHFPGLPQIACFDTAFHAGMPELAQTLPLPKALKAEGIQRYGFHGLSCESILRQLGDAIPARLVIAHLGNGASVTAVRNGKSIDSSMGLTPAGGMVMGTRTGDLDPGVLLYLLREKKMDADALEDLIDRHSGLLGISGIARDLRTLHQDDSADARLAIAMFCTSAAKQIAAMMVSLRGIDLLVFTGGIGEHDAEIRRRICALLSWTGLHLDEASDRSAAAVSPCQIRILPAREEQEIALHAGALLAALTA